MARINIEDTWWTDARRAKLIQILKGNSKEADGLFFQALKMAQNHCETGTIPWSEAECLEGIEHLIECSLVDIIQANAKQTPSKAKEVIAIAKEDRATYDQIQAYVRGSKQSHDWLRKRREAASKGGAKSSKRPRLKDGKLQANAKQNEANSNQTQASYSSSSSSSCSYSDSESGSGSLNFIVGTEKKIPGIPESYPEEFETLWKLYERRGDKKAAFGVYKQLKLNDDALAALTQGITNYVKSTPEVKYRKHFERFLKTDWLETAQTPVVQLVPKSKAQQIRENNRRLFEQQFAKIKAEKEGLV